MSGSDGRYMSVVSGPIALSAASKAVSANVPVRSIWICLSRYGAYRVMAGPVTKSRVYATFGA